jgi:hypothetical protein
MVGATFFPYLLNFSGIRPFAGKDGVVMTMKLLHWVSGRFSTIWLNSAEAKIGTRQRLRANTHFMANIISGRAEIDTA